MTYRAVHRHKMMGGRGFRVEQLKFWTFVFQFLALMTTVWGQCKGQIYFFWCKIACEQQQHHHAWSMLWWIAIDNLELESCSLSGLNLAPIKIITVHHYLLSLQKNIKPLVGMLSSSSLGFGVWKNSSGWGFPLYTLPTLVSVIG